MPRYNEDIVELHKIINRNPIDTIWLYWETELTFDLVGTASQIVVSTHDKRLSGWSASLIVDENRLELPVGTYSLGTHSYITPYPSGNYNQYNLICGTVGYVKNLLNFTQSINYWDEDRIPNQGETYLEWELATETDFRNVYKGSKVVTGASFSSLLKK